MGYISTCIGTMSCGHVITNVSLLDLKMFGRRNCVKYLIAVWKILLQFVQVMLVPYIRNEVRLCL